MRGKSAFPSSAVACGGCVAVARAVLYQPQILLLDEPFKGLDEDTRAQTAAFLRRVCAQATVVLVTHDAAEAA